jgi:hypothetical protein
LFHGEAAVYPGLAPAPSDPVPEGRQKYRKIPKGLGSEADEWSMSIVTTDCEQYEIETEHPQFQLTTFSDEPASLLFNLNGIELDPIVERLEKGQASFVSTKHFDLFYEGQMIGPAVLSLQDEDMVVVNPVVKSKNWPLINVEFMQLSEKDRRTIARSLATASSGMRPPKNRRTYIATAP